MKVIVFNVAAESGGALTILKKYYEEALKQNEFEWYFIVSNSKLESRDNVSILNYSWVKKSWFHRLFFDYFIAPKMVKKINADIVLSLQNIIIPFTKVKQYVYFHQILPFSKKKFKLKEYPKLWVYQNIIGKLIIYSIKKADRVIVQANWIKELFVTNYGLNEQKISIEKPDLNIKVNKVFKTNQTNGKALYFYPANGEIYKNHSIIIEVANKLKIENKSDFEIIFTINGNENSHTKELQEEVISKNLPIKFVGMLPLSDVYDLYSKSILLFPSYLETYGLPLIEAKLHETPIIVADIDYAHETLNGYNKVSYFDPFDSESLYSIMKSL